MTVFLDPVSPVNQANNGHFQIFDFLGFACLSGQDVVGS